MYFRQPDYLISSLHKYYHSSELIKYLLYYSFFLTVGQAFLYQFLEKYGPLTLSNITSVRKILSIAVSIIVFNKPVSLLKIISLVLGTSVILWEIVEKQAKSKAHHAHGHHHHHNDEQDKGKELTNDTKKDKKD